MNSINLSVSKISEQWQKWSNLNVSLKLHFFSCLILRHRSSFHTARSLCLRYDEELGVVYMAARLAGGYAAVRRAINEVTNKCHKLFFFAYNVEW